jgi:protease PrsW
MQLFLTEVVHWGLALVPVLVLLVIFVGFDAFKLMSLSEVVVLLLLGGIGALAAWPVAGRMLDTLPIGFSFYSRFVAPWIEEVIKAALMVLLFRMNRIGYKVDAVISGFAIGAGFSVIENIIYLVRYPDYAAGTWLVRGFGTAIMHGTTLALLAAIAHQFAERELRESAGEFDFHLWWFLPGYLLAVGLHTGFNQFPDRPLLAMLGASLFAPIAMAAIFAFGTAEAERWLKAESVAHHLQLDALRTGNWPEGPAGQRIAAFAARLDDESVKRIRRYWEVLAWLVTQSEETMIEEAEGHLAIDADQVRAAFAELSGLKRALGTSTYTAVRALLPFSRNDYWELSELRQRIHRR